MSKLIVATDAVDLDDLADDAVVETVPELTDAQRAAIGLRQLADLLDANPDLPGCTWAFHDINIFADDREGVAAWARATMRATGKTEKWQGGNWAGAVAEFGPVRAKVLVEREKICERVVTGVREVTEEVPDPEALAALPKVTVTTPVEIVEWVCRPLLAEPAQVAAAVLTPDADELPAEVSA